MAGTNTYSGSTTVNRGELVVSGSLASPVTVNGGTLGGTGFLSSVTVNSGGAIAPGGPLGTMSVSGDLALSSGAKMDYELDTPFTSDAISCDLLQLRRQQFSDFQFTWTADFGPGVYDLIIAESVSGTGLGNVTSGTIDGYPAKIAMSGNELVLTVTPEPSRRWRCSGPARSWYWAGLRGAGSGGGLEMFGYGIISGHRKLTMHRQQGLLVLASCRDRLLRPRGL